MGANAVLDIAIGLVLMYLVLSLIGTVLNEYIATKMKLRASILKGALQEILDNATLRSDFYNHGLVDGANKAVGEDHVSYLSGSTFAMAVLGSVDPTKPLPGFAEVKSAVETMPDCNIRDVLLAQITSANGSLEALRSGVAKYFDTAMDRVSGTYKRKLKLISLLVGLGIVIFLNADTIAIGTALWKDASLRAQMVQSASSILASGQSTALSNDQKIADLEGKLRPLPIGINLSDIGRAYDNISDWVTWKNQSSWNVHLKEGMKGIWWTLAKVLGLAMSALAISLGAPFWFDMLSKFMNVRGAGPPPERTST